MPFYRAYDLSVVSDTAVPGLAEVSPVDRPDLHLFFSAGAPPTAAGWLPWFESPNRARSGRSTLVAHRSADAALVRFTFDEGPAFTVDKEARRVWIRGEEIGTNGHSSALPYLLGPVFGIVLRMQGVACLHASAVVLRNGAHVFVGAEGSGKSTLAAQFAAEGIPVLTDDVVALRLREGRWFVAPGYPRVRLWDDAAATLPVKSNELAAPANGSTRFQFDLTRAGAFAPGPEPVACLYFLEYGAALTAPVVEPYAAADALPVLAANTFAHRVLSREQRAEEFAALGNLLAAVPLRRLRRPPTLSQLPETTMLVREGATPVNRYKVYGRRLHTNRQLTALVRDTTTDAGGMSVRLVDRPETPGQVAMTERYVSSFRSNTQRPMLRAGVTASGFHILDYWDGTRCTIDASAASLVLESPPGAGDAEDFLLGLGLSFALRLRGDLVAHAAALKIDKEAVLLAGLPSAGKSTLAAALHSLGHEALSDDVCVIDSAGGRHVVHAGPRRLRLHASAHSLLERTMGRTIPVSAAPDGRHLDMLLPATRPDADAAPVRAIYWLERIGAGENHHVPEIRSLTAADAVVRLISDTWGARLLDTTMRSQEFERACALIGGVHTGILRYADGPASLLAAAHCLVRDATAPAVRRGSAHDV